MVAIHLSTFFCLSNDFLRYSIDNSHFRFQLPKAGEPPCTHLSYTVEVMPQIWLPIRLVEGRIAKDILTNLSSIQAEALRRVASHKQEPLYAVD